MKKDIATNYMKIWNAGQCDLLDKYASTALSVDYSHFPQTIEGIPDYKEMLKMTYEYFPDLKISIDRTYGQNQSITVIWTYWGTFTNGELFGKKANNQDVKVSGMTVLEIDENALVVNEKGIVDNLSLAMQIGAL